MNNSDLIILLLGSCSMLVMVVVIIFFTYTYQAKIKQKEENIKAVQGLLKEEELKATYALLEGQDNERLRIAQDLHDGLGAQLSVIKIYTDLLQQGSPTKKQQDLIQKQNIAIVEAIKNIRFISHNLSNSVLAHFGLKKALKSLTESLNSTKTISITTHTSFVCEPNLEISRTIYQIIQELFNNTIKHADATQITVELSVFKDALSLILVDNGTGFNTAETNPGLGLKSIRLRVKKLKGDFSIDSNPKTGTTVIIEIPFSNEV
ncbi:MAG: sensor histidine kinase [Lishizhenia sp.]